MAIWGALAVAAAGLISTLISNRQQKKHNKELAQYQNDANRKMLQEQLDYNTPENQMKRFQEAGLNPHLVYGQGSPGNQSAPLTYPDIKPTDMSKIAEVVPLFNQSMLTQSQVQAQDAKTRQTYAMTELNKLQARVLEKNPLLNDSGFKAILDSLKATAEIKAQESQQANIKTFVDDATSGWQVNKIAKEVQLLEQRFNLGTTDQAIKAQILKSKEFQNAISEIQTKFMTDGDVSPGQILQFIQTLLLKIL